MAKKQIKYQLEDDEIEIIEDKIKYTFEDKKWLHIAFTKDTCAKEYKDKNNSEIPNNQILEFYGDSVLNNVIVNFLAENVKIEERNESELTNFVCYFVNKIILSDVIKELDISKYLLMGEGDKKNDVHLQQSVMEALFEAIIGAIWFDDNKKYDNVNRIVKDLLKLEMNDVYFKSNSITRLKEYFDKNKKSDIEIIINLYELTIRSHKNQINKIFILDCDENKRRIHAADLACKFFEENGLMTKEVKKFNKMNSKEENNILQEKTNSSYISQKMVDSFVDYCVKNFDLNNERYSQYYQSLSVCILDCVYSLRAKYFKVTVPVVERYAAKFMNGDRFSQGDTLEKFIKNIDSYGDSQNVVNQLLLNRQIISNRLKIDVCYELAEKLLEKGIHNIDDFRKFESVNDIEEVIRSVKGIGDAALNYLFMLAGDPDRCKPDVHIKKCIKDALNVDLSNDECQILFSETVKILKFQYSNISVSLLDGIIWNKYQAKK